MQQVGFSHISHNKRGDQQWVSWELDHVQGNIVRWNVGGIMMQNIKEIHNVGVIL
jgi:hypothetical protein